MQFSYLKCHWIITIFAQCPPDLNNILSKIIRIMLVTAALSQSASVKPHSFSINVQDFHIQIREFEWTENRKKKNHLCDGQNSKAVFLMYLLTALKYLDFQLSECLWVIGWTEEFWDLKSRSHTSGKFPRVDTVIWENRHQKCQSCDTHTDFKIRGFSHCCKNYSARILSYSVL